MKHNVVGQREQQRSERHHVYHVRYCIRTAARAVLIRFKQALFAREGAGEALKAHLRRLAAGEDTVVVGVDFGPAAAVLRSELAEDSGDGEGRGDGERRLRRALEVPSVAAGGVSSTTEVARVARGIHEIV